MRYLGFFDGSATPNPGLMVIGGLVRDSITEKLVCKYSTHIGHGTNNEAEYNSLIELLYQANNIGIKSLHIKGDSLLVVNQVNGLWKAKNPRMKKLKLTVLNILENFDEWKLEHVPRSENKEADFLT